MIDNVILKITNRCNWNCLYCTNVKNEDVPVEKTISMINKLQLLNPDIRITLSGGEPSLLSKDYFKRIFEVTNKKIDLQTNGTFFNKKLHYEFKDYIHEYWYHVSPEIKERTIYVETSDIKTPIKYIFVIHKKNLKSVIPYMKANDYYTYDPRFYIGDNPELILEQDDIKYLYNEGILDMNITQEYKNRIRYFNDVTKVKINLAQEYCYSVCYIPRIDLITDTMYRCCAGVSDIIDNSKINGLLLKLMIQNNIFLSENRNNSICKSCFNGAWNCKDYV